MTSVPVNPSEGGVAFTPANLKEGLKDVRRLCRSVSGTEAWPVYLSFSGKEVWL